MPVEESANLVIALQCTHTHVHLTHDYTLQLIMIYGVSRSISNTVDFLGPYWYSELCYIVFITLTVLCFYIKATV